VNPQLFIEEAQIDIQWEVLGEDAEDRAIPELNDLSDSVVAGTTLLDFTAVPSPTVRAGISLSMLFADRVATIAAKAGDGPDDWLESYTSSLSKLGFSVSGKASVHSHFRKNGLLLHRAIIPFLTVAFGGDTVGPAIVGVLTNLQSKDAKSSWIKLFEQETRRFGVQELHFGAASSDDVITTIRYGIARLQIEARDTGVLFCKLTDAEAVFESVTTTMTVDNELLKSNEPRLRARLERLIRSFICQATIC